MEIDSAVWPGVSSARQPDPAELDDVAVVEAA